MTQEELAEKADCHPNYVGAIERGERNVALVNILYLARALGVRPEVLFQDFTEGELTRLPRKSVRRLRTGR
jgi:transcriptional regulator with XRE-family HTH domain